MGFRNTIMFVVSSKRTSVKMYSSLLTYFLLLALGIARESSIQADPSSSPNCYDENGRPVDWFIAYKFPELSDQSEPFNSGYAYAYITSETIKGRQHSNQPLGEPPKPNISFSRRFNSFLRSIGIRSESSSEEAPQSDSRRASNSGRDNNAYWTISDKLITDPTSVVLRTLSIAFESDRTRRVADKINSIFYNDAPVERPDSDSQRGRSSSARAHAKGAVLMDDITGKSVWLTHSTPQFPPPRSMRLSFHENSRTYGQTFMCINFDLRQSGKQIVEHLINMHPLVYDSQISDRLQSLIPELHDLELETSRGRRRKNGRRRQTNKLAQKISTGAGESLNIFSKSADFGEDLYSGWIDSELRTALYVETWRNGAGTPLNSSCPRDNYNVNNVQDLKIRNDAGRQVTWSYHRDHSKWAISDEKEAGVVCISDINRMKSQFKRGGGAVCIKCPKCWSVFSATILDLEPCPVSKKNNNRTQSY